MRTAPSTRSAPSVFKPHAARRPCPSSARANSNTSAPECQPERPPTRPATRPRNKRRPLRNKARYRPRFGSQNQAISQIWHAKTDGFAQVRDYLRTAVMAHFKRSQRDFTHRQRLRIAMMQPFLRLQLRFLIRPRDSHITLPANRVETTVFIGPMRETRGVEYGHKFSSGEPSD